MSRQRHQRLGRVIRLVVVVVAAFELALQLFLNSPIVPALVGRGGDTQVSWRSAWALWPTRVHVRGFDLLRHEQFGSWRLRIARADARIEPEKLRERRFVTQSLEANGVTVVVDADAPGKPPDPPWHVSTGRRWGFELHGVRLHDLDELTMGRLHLAGPLEASGAFLKTQDRHILVQDVHMHLERGLVSGAGGTRGMLRSLDLHADGGGRKVPGEGAGLALVRGLSGSATLRAGWDALDWLGSFLAQDPNLVRGGAGSLEGDVRVVRGTLAEGTRLVARGSPLTLAGGPVVFRGPYAWSLAVPPEGGPTQLEARVAPLEVRGSSRRSVLLVAPELRLALEGRGRRLVDLFAGYDVRLRVRGASLPFLHTTEHWRDQPLELTSGAFSLDAGLRVPRTPGDEARALVRGEKLVGRWGGTALRGRLTARIRATDLGFGRYGGSVTLRARELQIGAGTGNRPFEASIGLSRLRIDPDRGTFGGVAEGRLSDARPLLVLLGNGGNLPRLAAWVLDLKALSVRGRVGLSPGVLALDHLDLRSGDVHVRGKLRTVGGESSAILLMNVSGLPVGLEVAPQGTDVHVQDPNGWFERRTGPSG